MYIKKVVGHNFKKYMEFFLLFCLSGVFSLKITFFNLKRCYFDWKYYSRQLFSWHVKLWYYSTYLRHVNTLTIIHVYFLIKQVHSYLWTDVILNLIAISLEGTVKKKQCWTSMMSKVRGHSAFSVKHEFEE